MQLLSLSKMPRITHLHHPHHPTHPRCRCLQPCDHQQVKFACAALILTYTCVLSISESILQETGANSSFCCSHCAGTSRCKRKARIVQKVLSFQSLIFVSSYYCTAISRSRRSRPGRALAINALVCLPRLPKKPSDSAPLASLVPDISASGSCLPAQPYLSRSASLFQATRSNWRQN